MPAEEELNKMFLELVDELDLTQANRQAVLALPANKKWQIYCSRKGNGTLENGGLRTTDLSGDPDDYIDRIRAIASVSRIPLFFDIIRRPKLIRSLRHLDARWWKERKKGVR